MVSQRLRRFGTTVFTEISQKALELSAVNLGQGFPDFDGPPDVIERAREALLQGHNQYARSQGILQTAEAVADHRRRYTGLEYNPTTEVALFSGATEALFDAMMGLLDPEDEVILFEPVYDAYPAAAQMAGVSAVYYTLEAPQFRIEFERLEALVTSKTKLVLLNTPHNPTGRVFSEKELEAVAEVARRHDLIVVADEVYEHIVFGGHHHRPIASLPGLRERTVSISSLGKTWSVTGWKIGWATGPSHIIQGLQAAHQFVTFSTATPLQFGAAYALSEAGSHPYIPRMQSEYSQRRDLLTTALALAGFEVIEPQGAYFVLADFRRLFQGTDVEFVHHLMEEVGVAAIPVSMFYPSRPSAGQHLVRFAFCKKTETLREAIRRLGTMKK